MNDNKTDVYPPPFNSFVFTGQLMSEKPTSSNVISEIYSHGNMPAYRSNNPFKPSMSPHSGFTNSPRSPPSHFDSEKAKATIKEVME